MLPINLKKSFLNLKLIVFLVKKMENLRKRINVELINNAKDYLKCVSKPTFISQKYLTKMLLLFIK